MTTSGVNPGGGPLNALAALGQQPSRDGSGKHACLDFAGLLSRLSVAADSGSSAKTDPVQPLVAGAAVDTLTAQRNVSAGLPAAQRSLDGEVELIMQAEAEGSIAVADDATVGEEGSNEDDLLQALHVETETAPATGRDTSRDGSATAALMVQAQGQPEEIQALLSSVMRSAASGTVGNLPLTTAKTSAQAAAPAQGARAKTVGEATGAAAQGTIDAQLPVDTDCQGPIQVSLDRLADTMMPHDKDQGTPSAPAADLKLAVLQTETHHAPILHGGPMAQIAEGIRSDLAAGGDTALTWSPSASAAAKPHADAPVKVLLIQLQPADLGTVTIRMSLKEDALVLHIEASQQDTAQRLQQDQDSLSKVLRSAGYLIDGVAIRAADPDRSLVLPSQTSASLSQSSHQQTAGGAPSEGGASQGRGHHEQAARGQARQDATAEPGGSRPSSSGGLFV